MKCSNETQITVDGVVTTSLLFKEALQYANTFTEDDLKSIGLYPTDENKIANISEGKRLFAIAMFELSQQDDLNIIDKNVLGEATLDNIFKIIKQREHPYSVILPQPLKVFSSDRLITFDNHLDEIFTSTDLSYYSIVLASIFIQNMDNLLSIKNGKYIKKDGVILRKNIKAELLKLLNIEIDKYRDKEDNAKLQVTYDAFIEDYTKSNSVIWKAFKRYINSRHGITVNNTDVELRSDESGIEVVSNEQQDDLKEVWADENQAKIDRSETISGITKLGVAKIIANIPNSRFSNNQMYIPEPYDIAIIWNQLINAHLADTTTSSIEATLQRLGQSNPVFLSILQEFRNAKEGIDYSKSFASGYAGSVSLAVIPTIKLQIKEGEIAQFVLNRDAFADKNIYNNYLNTIIYSLKHKEYEKLKELNIPIDETILSGNYSVAIEAIYNRLKKIGIDISMQTLLDYITLSTSNGTVKNIQDIRFDVVSSLVQNVNYITNYMNKVIANTELLKNLDEKTFDEKSNLLKLAQMGALAFNVSTSLSFLDVNGSLNHSPEFDNLITNSFRGLIKAGRVDQQEVLRVFSKYTEDPTFDNENFIWHDPKLNPGYGIFNFKIDPNTNLKVIDNINVQFIHRISLFKFNGGEYNKVGLKYADIESTNWLYNDLLLAMHGQFIIPTSDSSRAYGLNIPLINITDEMNSDNDFFQGIEINTNHPIFNALRNIVKQDIDEYDIARSKVFTLNVDGVYESVDQTMLDTLHGVKHYKLKLNKQGQYEGIVMENGKPAGRAFQFLNLTYKVKNKVYSFEDHLNSMYSNKEILYLTKDEMTTVIDGFIIKYVNATMDSSFKALESLKPYLLKNTTKIERNLLNKVKNSSSSLMNQIVAPVLHDPEPGDNERAAIATELHNTNNYRNIIAETVFNAIINNVSINNLFLGKINEYKNVVDYNKRIAQGVKNGFRATIAPEEDYKNIIVVSDIKSGSNIMNLLRDDLSPSLIRILSDAIPDTTDGISIITSDEYKRQMQAVGRFESVRNVFEKLENNKPITGLERGKLVEQLKLFGTNRSVYNGTIRSIQIKDSTHIIFKNTTTGSELNKIYDFLVRNELGQLSFESAIKVSGIRPILIEDILSGKLDKDPNAPEDAPSPIENNILRIKLSDMMVQQDTPAHILDEFNKLGTQLSKRLLEGINITKSVYNLNGKKHTGKEIAKIYNDLMGANFEEASYALLKELGALDGRRIKLDRFGNIDLDKTKLQEIIEKYLSEDTDNYNNLMAITKGLDGRSNLPLSSPIIFNNFTSILLARITKDVVDYKVPGAHLTIIPNVLMNPSITNYDEFSKILGEERNNLIDEFSRISFVTYDDQFIAEVKLGGSYQDVITGKNIEGLDIIVNEFVPNKGTFDGKVIYGREDFKLRAESVYDKETGDLIYPADVIMNPWSTNMYDHLVTTEEVEVKEEPILDKDGKVIKEGKTYFKTKKYVDINAIPEDAKKMLAIRIPTEGKQSTVILRVVGFLNTGSSQAMFPHTLMTRTGWDFDIDTVYIQYKKTEIKNGNIQTIKYNDKATTNDLAEYVNKTYPSEILDIQNKLLDNTLLNQYLEVIKKIENINLTNGQFYLSNVAKHITKLMKDKDTDPIIKKDLYHYIQLIKTAIQSINTVETNISKFKRTYARYSEYNAIIKGRQELNEEVTEEHIEDIKKLGIVFQNNYDSILSALTNTMVASKQLKNIITDNKLSSDLIFEIEKIKDIAIDSIDTVLVSKIIDEIVDKQIDIEDEISDFNKTKLEEFNQLDINLQNTKDARANKLLDIFFAVLGNKEHANEVNTPNNFDNIQKDFQYVNSAYGQSVNDLNVHSLIDQTVLNNLNMSIKKLKGFSVSWDNAMAIMGFLNVKSSEGVTKIFEPGELGNINKTTLKELFGSANLVFKETRFGEEIKIKNIPENISKYYITVKDKNFNNNRKGTNTDVSGNRISDQMSETTANILDAVKNLMGFNLNTHTHGVFRVLSSGATMTFGEKGWNRFTIATLFIHQPVVVDIINSLNTIRVESPTARVDLGIAEARYNLQLKIYDLYQDVFEKEPSFARSVKNLKEVRNREYKLRKGRNIILSEDIIKLRDRIPSLKIYGVGGAGTVFTNSELQSFINNKDNVSSLSKQDQFEYYLQQLNVLNRFEYYNNIANKVTTLNRSFKTEDSVGPDFLSVEQKSINIANIYMSIDDFTSQIANVLDLTDKQKYEYIRAFELTSTAKERKEIVDQIPDITATPFFTINGKSLIEKVFPGEFDTYFNEDEAEDNLISFNQSYKNSEYGNIEAKYQYGHYLASILFNNTFLQQNTLFKRTTKETLLRSNLSLDSKYGPIISSKLVNHFINDSALFAHVSNEEWSRILNIKTEFSTHLKIGNVLVPWEEVISKHNISDEIFKAWTRLTPANKIDILQHTEIYKTYFNHPKFRDAHILKDIRVVTRGAEKKGYNRIVYKVDGKIANLAIASFRDMYMSKNPYLANVARDLILNTYKLTGLQFGFNLTKAIPIDIFTNNNLVNRTYESFVEQTKYNDPASLINEYSNIIKYLEDKANQNESFIQLDQALPYIHAQLHFSKKLNMVIPTKDMIQTSKERGKYTASFTNDKVIKITYANKEQSIPLIVESADRLLNSKYNKTNFITKGKIIYRKFTNDITDVIKQDQLLTEDKSDELVIFYGVNKLESNEWTNVSLNSVNNIYDMPTNIIEKNIREALALHLFDDVAQIFSNEEVLMDAVKKSNKAKIEDKADEPSLPGTSNDEFDSSEDVELEAYKDEMEGENETNDNDYLNSSSDLTSISFSNIIETNKSTTETIKNIIAEHDAVIFIGSDQTFLGKTFKGNSSNPLIQIDINKNAKAEAIRISEYLANINARNINISGDKVLDLGKTQSYTNGWVTDFMIHLTNNVCNITDISTYGEKGVGVAVNLFHGKHKSKTYINQSVSLSELDNDKADYMNIYNKNAQVATAGMIFTLSARNTFARESMQTKGVHILNSISNFFETKGLIKTLNNHDLATLQSILGAQAGTINSPGSIYAILSTVDDLYNELKNVQFQTIFDDKERFNEVKQQLSLALQLVETLDLYRDMKLFNKENLYEFVIDDKGEKIYSEYDINDFNHNIKPINELISRLINEGKRANLLKSDIHNLGMRLIMDVAIRYSKNPQGFNLFTKFKEQIMKNGFNEQDINIDIDRNSEEYKELVKFIFTGSKDITWAQKTLDSAFNTGIPFMDIATKQYIYDKSHNMDLANSKVIKFHNLLKEHNFDLVDRDTREKQFAKYITATGSLITEYNTDEFIMSWRQLYGDLNAILKNIIGDPKASHQSSEWAAYNIAKDNAINKWANDHTNFQETGIRVKLTADEALAIDKALEKITDRDRKKYLMHNMLYQFIHPRDKTTEYIRITPNSRYRNVEFSKLTNEEKKFTIDLHKLFEEIVLDYNKNYFLKDNFLPFVSRKEISNMLGGMFGLQSTKPILTHDKLSGRTGYHAEAQTLKRPEYYPILKPDSPLNNQTAEEYDAEYIAKSNRAYSKFKYKALGSDFKFETLEDIDKYNAEAKNKNILEGGVKIIRDIKALGEAFIHELYSIKAVNDYSAWHNIIEYYFNNDVQFSEKGLDGKVGLNKILSAITEDYVVKTVGTEGSNAKKQLDRILPVLYNVPRVTNGWDQMFSVAGRLGSITFMWGNYLGGFKNVTKGLVDMTSHAFGNQFVDSSSLRWALSHYPTSELLSAINPEFKQEETSDLKLAIIKHFDDIFLSTADGQLIMSGNQALVRGLMGLDSLMYSPNNLGEHYMQFSMLLAMAKSHRVSNGFIISLGDVKGSRTKEIIEKVLSPEQRLEFAKYNERQDKFKKDQDQANTRLNKFVRFIAKEIPKDKKDLYLELIKKSDQQITEDFNKLPTLYDSLEIVDGRLSIKPESGIKRDELANFGQRVKTVNQDMHGIYNTIDRMAIQDRMIGENVAQFRKWMRSTFNTYFGRVFNETRFSENKGAYEVPTYSPFFNFVAHPWQSYKYNRDTNKGISSMVNIFTGYYDLLINTSFYYNTLPEFEKAAARRFAAHVTSILAFGVALALTGRLKDPDDDDKQEAYGLATTVYELNAIYMELIEPVPVLGWWGSVKMMRQQSMVSEKIFVDLAKFIKYGFLETLPDTWTNQDKLVYDRGVYKGMSKMNVQFDKLVPIVRQIHKQTFIPSYAQFYKMYNPFL